MGYRRHRILKRWALSHRSTKAVLFKHRLTVNEPMIVVSQISRSGGTLMGELMDNHPELWFVHRDMKFNRRNWPRVNLNDSWRKWWQQLHRSDKLAEDYAHGFTKKYNTDQPLPLIIDLPAQKYLFRRMVRDNPPQSVRDIWDIYLSAHFTAWLDYQHRYSPKQAVVNFSSWTMLFEDNVASFFDAYPDGRLIQIARNPVSWCASVNKQGGRRAYDGSRFQTPEQALPWWRFNAESIERNRKKYGDRVIVLDFDGLIRNTAETMKLVCDALGITYHSTLTEPTLNGLPILANSSYSIRSHGISQASTQRQSEFDADTVRLIEKETAELSDRLRAITLNR